MAFIKTLANAKGRGVGKYRYQVHWNDPATGRRKAKTFQDKREAKVFEAAMGIGDPVFVARKYTFGNLTQDFMSLDLEHVKPTTKKFYMQIINSHLLPRWKDHQLALISFDDVEKFRKDLTDIVSNTTAANVLRVLVRVLNYGITKGKIQTNVASLVRKPTIDEREIHPLEAGERERLLLALPPKYRVLHWLAMYSGLRLGELYGLRWSDISFDKQQLHVRQQYQDGIFDTPKTKNSKRIVSLDDRTIEQLRRWRVVTPKNDYDLVFATSTGHPLHKSNVNRRIFKPALKAAELSSKIRFHDLRHTFASMALSEGVPMADLSKMLGHSSINTTVNIYGHLMEESHRRMRSAIGRQTASMPDAVESPAMKLVKN